MSEWKGLEKGISMLSIHFELHSYSLKQGPRVPPSQMSIVIEDQCLFQGEGESAAPRYYDSMLLRYILVQSPSPKWTR